MCSCGLILESGVGEGGTELGLVLMDSISAAVGDPTALPAGRFEPTATAGEAGVVEVATATMGGGAAATNPAAAGSTCICGTLVVVVGAAT